MKRKVSNYFWVGLMTIVVSVSTIWLLASMGGGRAESDPYYSYYSNVSGLGFGTPIYFEGYRIGEVTSVIPERTATKLIFKVTYEIEHNWQVPTDSTAQIESVGLLGDISINIKAGEANTYLSVGSEIQGKLPADLFGQLAEISSDIDDLTEEKIKPLLDMVYERTDSITASMETQIPTLLESLNASATEINALIKDSRQFVNKDNQQYVTSILKNVDSVTVQLQDTVNLAQQSLQSTQALVQDFQQLINQEDSQISNILNTAATTMWTISERLDVITSEIESASMNLNEATNQIRKNPSALIFSSKSEAKDGEL